MAKGWDTFKAWIVEGAKDLHNNIVPAFPSYAHGVDEAGTPQNNRSDPEAKPSFEERIATTVRQAVLVTEKQIDKGMEL